MKETKFKDTEIGKIPEEWEVRTINSFCSVKTGPFGSMLHAEDYVAKGTLSIPKYWAKQNYRCLLLMSSAV